jgi:hypothetical protein
MQPHEQRVVDEKHELDEKIAKLDKFISGSPNFEGLEAEDKELLQDQQRVMITYSVLLGRRISRFKL